MLKEQNGATCCLYARRYEGYRSLALLERQLAAARRLPMIAAASFFFIRSTLPRHMPPIRVAYRHFFASLMAAHRC